MTEWVLILLFSGGYSGGITSVSGFKSEKSCMEAAKKYEKTISNGFFSPKVGVVCIEKK